MWSTPSRIYPSHQKSTQFQRETAKDLELKALISVILKGWPDNKEDVSPAVRQYWSYRDELTCLDGLLFKGDKIIVPKTLRSEMLEKIHETHLGIVKCKNRARQVLFWPGMSARIEETVSACALCAEHSRANAKEPLIPMEIPERPWAKVGADLFEFNNQHYLLIVDYFSKWPEISKLDNLSAKNVISFSRYGIHTWRVRSPGMEASLMSWGAAGEFSSPGWTFCADSNFGIRSTPVLPQ